MNFMSFQGKFKHSSKKNFKNTSKIEKNGQKTLDRNNYSWHHNGNNKSHVEEILEHNS